MITPKTNIDEGRAVKHRTDFGNNSPYLNDNFVIDLRRDVAWQYFKDRSFERVLDVGCGDGRISIDLVEKARIARFVDASPQMIDAARVILRTQGLSQVETHCYNFEHGTHPLEEDRYDLIVCTGVLAHVDDPARMLQKLIKLADKTAVVLLQNTDASHPYSLMVNAVKDVCGWLGIKSKWTNRIKTKELVRLMSGEGFMVTRRYNYISSFPLVGALMPKECKYGINKLLFRKVATDKPSILGNESLILFERRYGSDSSQKSG